ncbi:RNA polymerase sigma factor [Streptosporangium carneum]|uniref:HTH luxR-type domain-containing protein n=1 Tax=Streptosporangium carneum TaxID=47481 RepID=A0A9W6I9P5_9ACTN|nr:sigma-70 family RNA polymerase sigma factor [Streptosporangium carneum]GLK13490.1 hypothetical protein GCM10017600_69010 [Streptosporangium carneum]
MSDHEPERTLPPPLLPVSPSDALDQPDTARLAVDHEFSTFYRTTIRQLVVFLLSQGAELTVAADIAQDTMTKAYQRWTEIDQPKAWAYAVASRALIRKIVDILEDPCDQLPEPTSLLPHPDAAAEWEARHDTLRMLRNLPPRQRQILAWTLDGYTPTEIAEQLCITPNTVSANLKKARRAAAHYLKTREEEQ